VEETTVGAAVAQIEFVVRSMCATAIERENISAISMLSLGMVISGIRSRAALK